MNFQKKLREIIDGLTLDNALKIGLDRREFYRLKKKLKSDKPIVLRKKILEKISANFNTKVPYRGKNYHYQNVLFDNIRNLAHHISDKKKKFDFDIPKLIIQREDTAQLRKKILALTTEDRKRLGINKSTLWYMKKNISDGKTAKIYSKVAEKLV